jgi:hypothetical protein
MPLDAAFAPFRTGPGALPAEAARRAEALGAGPLVAAAGDPLPGPLLSLALAEVPAGRAASEGEACRAADGTPSGMGGPLGACLVSPRHRGRVAEVARAALDAGFAGILLDRPDAPLARGLLGAGFCADCQREFARRLQREYGDQFQPLDYLALAREAVTSAPGAIGYGQLPYGREFWRFRHDSLEQAVRAYARAARDAARAADRPFDVAAWFEAVGPAQLGAARLLDAAVFPAAPDTGPGLLRLLRAVMGRQPVAVSPPAGATAAAVARLAALAAGCGIGVAGLDPGGDAGQALARVRGLAREVARRMAVPGLASPVAECSVIYSREADLWSGGAHRRGVELALEALSARHVQYSVVLRVADAPAGVALVLADAQGLTPLEARETLRRLENGAGVLAFGEPSRVDEAGRAAGGFLPAGKPGGARVNAGTVAQLPALAGGPPEPELLDKALAALLGKGRRLVGVSGRARLQADLWRAGDALDVHLVAGADRAQGVTLFLATQLLGGRRTARFRTSEGSEVSIRLNPSLHSHSTVLPSFSGYAVLSIEG